MVTETNVNHLSLSNKVLYCVSADTWSHQLEREKKHLEDELRELRSQATRSAVVVGDYSSIQKDLDRSEKQRAQLSDHIQVGKGLVHQIY